MSEIYDNWERLVGATLRREHLRICGLRTPSDLSTASPSPQRLFDSLTVCTIRFDVGNQILVRTTAPNILVNLAKLMLPRKSLRDKMTPKADKKRKKAMRIVISVPGVVSVALQGQDKNQMVVIGDGINPAELTSLLRKNVGYADLMSMGKRMRSPCSHQRFGLNTPHYIYRQ